MVSKKKKVVHPRRGLTTNAFCVSLRSLQISRCWSWRYCTWTVASERVCTLQNCNCRSRRQSYNTVDGAASLAISVVDRGSKCSVDFALDQTILIRASGFQNGNLLVKVTELGAITLVQYVVKITL